MKQTLVFGIFGFYLRDTIREKIELALLASELQRSQ
jgi:hypothetical protein